MTEAGVPTVSLNLIQTLGLGAVVYYLGVLLKKRLRLLDRLNIPAAVVGGLLFAFIILGARDRLLNLRLDTSAQSLFMVAFFTTIGMNASVPLLKAGGRGVVVFLLLSSLFCVVQNFVGMGIASLYGVHPLLGVMAGSVTLVGGPATGLAFSGLFRDAGLIGADTIAITSATFGIVCGGLAGGPVATLLITRRGVVKRAATGSTVNEEPGRTELPVDVEREDSSFVINMIILGGTMAVGSVVSYWIESAGVTLPAYIGAMVVASLARNLDDRTKWFAIDIRAMELIGSISLNIFLVVALMNLKLWELVHLALPLLSILMVQVAIVGVFTVFVTFRVMGKDYDSAVMAGGFIGFVLGTVANAVANMRSLVTRYGPAPRAFLIVPLVGAFFIDFVNALIITWFLNWLR